jgi:hypothetical protein
MLPYSGEGSDQNFPSDVWFIVFHSRNWGRLEVGKVWGSCRMPGDGPDLPHLLGTAHAPFHSLIIGWEPPGPTLLWGSVGFKGTWKRKVLSFCQQTPLASTMPPSSSSSLSSLAERAPFLNKAILPHPIHVVCLDFSIWSTKYRIFWSQTVPAPLTKPGCLNKDRISNCSFW